MLFMRAYTPANIVQFEMAHTISAAQSIITAWGESGVREARISIYLDFVFLILYSWAIGLGCRMAGNFSDIRLFKSSSIFFMRAAWFAGACDLIENFSMLFTLSHLNEFSVSMSFYFAVIKFLIAAIALIFILLASSVGLFNKVYKK
jgi:hypothetical protein